MNEAVDCGWFTSAGVSRSEAMTFGGFGADCAPGWSEQLEVFAFHNLYLRRSTPTENFFEYFLGFIAFYSQLEWHLQVWLKVGYHAVKSPLGHGWTATHRWPLAVEAACLQLWWAGTHGQCPMLGAKNYDCLGFFIEVLHNRIEVHC